MTFYGYDLLDWINPIDTIQRDISGKYNFVGGLYQKRYLHVQYKNYYKLQIKIAVDSAKARWDIKQFFINKKGKVELFFVPSFKKDFQLIKNITEGDNVIYTEYSYEDEAYNDKPTFIYFKDIGFGARIVESNKKFDDYYGNFISELVLDQSVPSSIDKSCSNLQLMFLVRFDSDSLPITMDDIHYGTATLSFIEATIEEIQALFGVL